MIKILYVLLLLGVVLSGCNSASTSSKNQELSEIEFQQTVKKAQKVFHVIPSPVEAAIVLQRAGVAYNEDLLNSYENVSKYQTIRKRAINLGVYGTDLSYSAVFEQTQASLNYFTAIKTLSEDIGLNEIINSELMERVENNIHRRDSLMSIIADVYILANEKLIENETDHISALIMAGGWIEALYMSTGLIEELNLSDDLLQRIAEQKYSLNNLIVLLETYKEKPSISELLVDLNKLKVCFDKISIEKNKKAIVTKNGVTRIPGKRYYKVSRELFEEIKGTAHQIRNKYV